MSSMDRSLIVFFRLAMAWTFLYAASHQVFDPTFTVAGFLSHTKTFHDLFAPLTAPSIAPVITFLVSYGHLLIGLSLLTGFLVRLSAPFGIALMLVYWMAHMDFPYIENQNNYLLDSHIVYAGILVGLIKVKAGTICGLDGWVKSLPIVAGNPMLRPLIG